MPRRLSKIGILDLRQVCFRKVRTQLVGSDKIIWSETRPRLPVLIPFLENWIKQDKVNNADSAFIFLIIQSQNQWSGWSGRRRWSCLVWSLLDRKKARMILIQNIQGLMGPLMINMAFMPLYMWEMWDVTPVTNARTHGKWKVVQYSVWAESAKIILITQTRKNSSLSL